MPAQRQIRVAQRYIFGDKKFFGDKKMENRAEDLGNKELGDKEQEPFRVISSEKGFHFNTFIERVKNVAFNPKGCWGEIKQEELTLGELYKSYLIVIAAIPAIFGFLGMVMFGITNPLGANFSVPFFSALGFHIGQFVSSLIMLFVAGQVISMLATRFGGDASVVDGTKLWGFAIAPAAVASVLGIIPALGFIAALVGLYGIYIYFQGITPMTGVPEDRRLGFAAGSIVLTILCAIVVYFIVGFIAPWPVPEIDISGLVSPEGINLEEATKQLERFMPKP